MRARALGKMRTGFVVQRAMVLGGLLPMRLVRTVVDRGPTRSQHWAASGEGPAISVVGQEKEIHPLDNARGYCLSFLSEQRDRINRWANAHPL